MGHHRDLDRTERAQLHANSVPIPEPVIRGEDGSLNLPSLKQGSEIWNLQTEVGGVCSKNVPRIEVPSI